MDGAVQQALGLLLRRQAAYILNPKCRGVRGFGQGRSLDGIGAAPSGFAVRARRFETSQGGDRRKSQHRPGVAAQMVQTVRPGVAAVASGESCFVPTAHPVCLVDGACNCANLRLSYGEEQTSTMVRRATRPIIWIQALPFQLVEEVTGRHGFARARTREQAGLALRDQLWRYAPIRILDPNHPVFRAKSASLRLRSGQVPARQALFGGA